MRMGSDLSQEAQANFDHFLQQSKQSTNAKPDFGSSIKASPPELQRRNCDANSAHSFGVLQNFTPLKTPAILRDDSETLRSVKTQKSKVQKRKTVKFKDPTLSSISAPKQDSLLKSGSESEQELVLNGIKFIGSN